MVLHSIQYCADFNEITICIRNKARAKAVTGCYGVLGSIRQYDDDPDIRKQFSNCDKFGQFFLRSRHQNRDINRITGLTEPERKIFKVSIYFQIHSPEQRPQPLFAAVFRPRLFVWNIGKPCCPHFSNLVTRSYLFLWSFKLSFNRSNRD